MIIYILIKSKLNADTFNEGISYTYGEMMYTLFMSFMARDLSPPPLLFS